jgi:predicted nucleic acid-binding protein
VSTAQYLVDTSALVRIFRDQNVRTRWEQQIAAGLLAVCPIVELEFLYTARSKADREELIELIEATFVWAPMPDRVFPRASEVQTVLTDRGTHRSASAVDLLVAATAELSQLTLLHYDRDYDQIAFATRQLCTWLAEPGSMHDHGC